MTNHASAPRSTPHVGAQVAFAIVGALVGFFGFVFFSIGVWILAPALIIVGVFLRRKPVGAILLPTGIGMFFGIALFVAMGLLGESAPASLEGVG